MSDKNEVKDISTIRIHDLIDESGLTREEIARTFNVDTSTITKYYNGDRKLTLETVRKFSHLFNVSADYILGLTDIKTTDKDEQFVCEFTGLNERAVAALQVRGDNEIISNIISSDEFQDGIDVIVYMKKKFLSDFNDNISFDLKDFGYVTNEKHKDIIESYNSLKIGYFDVSNFFNAVVRNNCEPLIDKAEKKMVAATGKTSFERAILYDILGSKRNI